MLIAPLRTNHLPSAQLLMLFPLLLLLLCWSSENRSRVPGDICLYTTQKAHNLRKSILRLFIQVLLRHPLLGVTPVQEPPSQQHCMSPEHQKESGMPHRCSHSWQGPPAD
ncbi:hypothetical protein COO60DRAFT_1527895, partial [Scenedesmus sp. NREL 46B-D3]